jgi:hypothetical protein
MVLCTEHLCWDKRYFWDDIYRSRSSCFSRGDIVNSPSMEYLSRYPLIHYRARSLKIKWERSRTSRSLAWDFERSRLRCLKKDLARGFSERGEMWYRSKRDTLARSSRLGSRRYLERDLNLSLNIIARFETRLETLSSKRSHCRFLQALTRWRWNFSREISHSVGSRSRFRDKIGCKYTLSGIIISTEISQD